MTRPLQVPLAAMSRYLRLLFLLPSVALSLGAGPPADVKPVHVDPIHVDSKNSEGSEQKDGKDPAAVKSSKLPHAHIQSADSEEERVWLPMKQDIRKWNELCDSLLNGTGVLARIVSLDRQLPVEGAPFGFETCKRDSTYAPYGNDVTAIISLNSLCKKHDEPALAAIERMFIAANGGDRSYGAMKIVLHYLANRSSKNCLPDHLLLDRAKVRSKSPHGPEADEYSALIELLRDIAAKLYVRSAKSDRAALEQAQASLRYNTQAVRRATTLLNTCFDPTQVRRVPQ